MKMCTVSEWDVPKEPEKGKAYYEYVKKITPFTDKLYKELDIHSSGWSDGAGHVINIVEYPSVEAYAKVLNNEEYQKLIVNLARRVQNASHQVLRQASFIPFE